MELKTKKMKAFTEISLLIIGILLFLLGTSRVASDFPFNLIPTMIGGIIIGRFISILKIKR